MSFLMAFEITLKPSKFSRVLDAPFCRTCLMVLLITAMGGVWTLEQPGGSLLEFYPTWRATMGYIFETGGDYAVLYLVVDI